MDVGQPNTSLPTQLSGTFVGTRDDLEVSRHVFFGEISYVVRDPVTFDGHNLSPTDYEIFTNLSDQISLGDVCQSLIDRGVFEARQTESFYQFVVELQKRNLLSLPVTDSEALYQQYEQKHQSRSKGLLMKLLFIRVPLGCPDRFLSSTYHLAAGFFTRTFFICWLIGLLAASFAIGSHWSEFTSDLSSALAIQNLPTMILVMAALKLWHELGHGYACRHFNVSVPNAGILFMLGTPLAFVDATGSWSLPKRMQRQIINLAGMYFEIMVSIIAAFVWVLSEESFLRSVAHFALLISSVTTIAFNVNPLMKYDGYFVLADLLGIPNLKGRSSATVRSLAKYLFFRLPMPAMDSKLLQIILIAYGIAAGIYRISLTVAIAILISMQVWIVGMLIGAYYALSSFGAMLKNVATYLIWSQEIKDQRRLAIGYLFLLGIVLPCAVVSFPIPGRVQARGIAQPANLAVVHSEYGGFVKRLAAEPGQRVETGVELTQIENPQQSNQHKIKRAQLDGLLVKYRRYRGQDLVLASQTHNEIKNAKFELAAMGESQSLSKISSPIDGIFIESKPPLKVGQFVQPGGEVFRVGGFNWVVKAVANDSSLANIQPEIGQQVRCRFLANSNSEFVGTIGSISASGNQVVPYKALTHLAGGFIPVRDESLEATEPFFELTIDLDTQCDPNFLKDGMVCEIRFGQPNATLGNYVYRALLRFYNQTKMSY